MPSRHSELFSYGTSKNVAACLSPRQQRRGWRK